MLIVTELSEAFENARRPNADGVLDRPDEHLPGCPGVSVELADAAIRIGDMIIGLQNQGVIPGQIGQVMAEKMFFNLTREDHSAASRAASGGKKS